MSDRQSIGISGMLVAASLGAALVPATSSAQTSCGDAPQQLQQYAAQVNQAANYWYYQGIPQYCQGNQYCAVGMLQQLNVWYQQQVNFVNQTYYKIATECSSSRSAPQRLPGRGAKAGKSEIDEGAIEDLEVDDDDATVAIVIPDNPRGFKPRQ